MVIIPVDVWQVRSSYPSPLASYGCRSDPISGQNEVDASNSSPNIEVSVLFPKNIKISKINERTIWFNSWGNSPLELNPTLTLEIIHMIND